MSTYSGIPVAIISQAPRQNAEAEAAHLATPIRSLSLHQSPQDGAGGDRTRSSYVVTQASTLLHHGKLKCGMRRPWCMQCLLTVPAIARGALICGGRVTRVKTWGSYGGCVATLQHARPPHNCTSAESRRLKA